MSAQGGLILPDTSQHLIRRKGRSAPIFFLMDDRAELCLDLFEPRSPQRVQRLIRRLEVKSLFSLAPPQGRCCARKSRHTVRAANDGGTPVRDGRDHGVFKGFLSGLCVSVAKPFAAGRLVGPQRFSSGELWESSHKTKTGCQARSKF